jgi:hypothetical protein
MNIINDLLNWYSSKNTPSLNEACETRDVFEARIQRFFSDLVKNKYSAEDASLIFSIAGELGNYSFDHNLGLWRDQPGCFFTYSLEDNGLNFVLADRGRGIYSSLKRIVHSLKNDQEAIEMAFEKVISGRAPENKGNGLKFVRQVINGAPERGLVSKSGSGIFSFGGNKKFLSETENSLKKIPKADGTLSSGFDGGKHENPSKKIW